MLGSINVPDLIGEDGEKALGNLTTARYKYKVIHLSVTAMLTGLKMNVQNAKVLMEMVPSGPLTAAELGVLSACLDILIKSSKEVVESSNKQVEYLAEVSGIMLNMEYTMRTLASRFEAAKEETSSYMAAKIKELRTVVYASCVAGIVFPPAMAACHAIALGIVEGELIPNLKAELDASHNSLQQFSTHFETLGNLSSALEQDVVSKISTLSGFTSELTSAHTLASNTEVVLLVDADVRALCLKKLQMLIELCDSVLDKFTARMNAFKRAVRKTSLPGSSTSGKTEWEKMFIDMAITQAIENSERVWKTTTKNIKF
mmetsp:Transcript_24857/g.53591  ORF Transcript_24857/g.53591 Transcript_24857/m.53591 type:complete len:316 (-) Transcript_24857:31-978(-)